MKKAFAFMLAIVMMLSLGITAFATEVTPGTITITNPTKGETYNLFKIFDATYATNDKGEILLNDKGNPTIAYTITNDAEHKFFNVMFGATPSVHPEYGQASDYFDYVASTGVVTRVRGRQPQCFYPQKQ